MPPHTLTSPPARPPPRQHWALARDLELLMLNAASVTEASPFGNGRLIPRGTLREVRALLHGATPPPPRPPPLAER